MTDRIVLPTRNVVAQTARNDQRFIKWFEDLTDTTNALIDGAAVSGGFLLDDGTATADGGFLMDDGGA